MIYITSNDTLTFDPAYALDDYVVFENDGVECHGFITEVHFEGNHFDFECSYDITLPSGIVVKQVTESDIIEMEET